jgi:hypothetical protein
MEARQAARPAHPKSLVIDIEHVAYDEFGLLIRPSDIGDTRR